VPEDCVTLLAARNHPIDCGTPFSVTGRPVFAKTPLADRSYDVLAVAQSRQSAGTASGETTFADKVYDTVSAASFVTDYQITVSERSPRYEFSGAVTSTPNLSITGQGRSFLGTFVSEGTARIVVEDFQGQATVLKVPLTSTVGGSAYTFNRYADGSLARHLIGLLDRLATPPSLELFTTQNPSTQTYIRNPACWVNDLDTTSKVAWNSSGGFGMGGCLVTPRHVAFISHFFFYPSVGSQIHFVGRGAASGQPEQVAVRTVSHVENFLNIPSGFIDRTLVRLSEPVPEFITPAKVLPPEAFWSNYTSYSAHVPRERAENQTGLNLPNVTGDGDLCVAGFAITSGNVARLRLPRVSNRQSWSSLVSNDYQEFLQYADISVPGDSGSPCYVVVDGEAVLLGPQTTATGGLTFLIDEPEAIPSSSVLVPSALRLFRDQIAAWGDNDVIETIDLSAFPTY
jgi:hypothetical protein